MAAYAYADESEVDESAIDQELGLLQAIYVHELEIQTDDRGHPAVLMLTLHPSTADIVDLQYVCLTLVFTLSPEYPVCLPEIAIKNPRGISDEKITHLSNQLHQLATEKKGSPMLYELIEVAKESLTSNNTPYGQCVICLEGFKEGEAFTRTSCYHYFHSDCLARYIQYALDNTDADEGKNVLQIMTGNKEGKNEVVCAVCRKPISYDLGQLTSTPIRKSEDVIYQPDTAMVNMQGEMAALYQKQREKGGIIDIEAQRNKFLIDISMTSTRPMNTGIGSKAQEEPVSRTRTRSPVSNTQRHPAKEVNEEDDKKSDGRLDKKPHARHYSSDKGTREGGKGTATSYYKHDRENKRDYRGRGSSRLTSAGRYENRQYYRSNRRHWRDEGHRPVANRDKSGNVLQRSDEKIDGDASVGSSAEQSTKSAVSFKPSADKSVQKASTGSSSNVEVNSQSNDIAAVEDSIRRIVESDEINCPKQTSGNTVCVQNGLDKKESSKDSYHEKSDTSMVKDTDDRRETNASLEEDETVPSKHGERSLGIDDGYTSNSARLDRTAGAKDKMHGNISVQKQKHTSISYQRRDRNNHPRKEFKNSTREYSRYNRQWDFDDKPQVRSNKCINDNEKSRDGVRNHRRNDFDSKLGKRTDKIKDDDSRPRNCKINHRGMAVDETENKRDNFVCDDNRRRGGQNISRSDFDNKTKKVMDSGKKYWENRDDAPSRQDMRKASKDGDKLLSDTDLQIRSSLEATAGRKDIVRTCGKGRGQSTWNRRKYQARYQSDVGKNAPRSGRGLVDRDVKSHDFSATSYVAPLEKPSESHINHNGMQTPPKSKQSLKSSKDDSLPSQSDSRLTENKEVKKPPPPPGFQQPPAKEGQSSVVKPPPGFKDLS